MTGLPDLRLLASFLAVLEAGSMVDAAASTGYVPSAISQHITTLEKTLEVELLARKPGRRVSPTAAGRSLEVAARTLFQSVATYQDLAAEISGSRIAEMRIGAFPSAMTYLLPDVLTEMAADEPGVVVHVIEVETPQGLTMLKNGQLDVLVAYRYLPDDPPSLAGGWSSISVGSEPLIVTSSGHLPEISFDECLGRRWVAGHHTNADTRLLRRWTQEVYAYPKIPFETADGHAAMALIESDLAVGILPLMTARDHLAAGRLRGVTLPSVLRPPAREILTVTRTTYQPALVARCSERMRRALVRVRTSGAREMSGMSGPGR